MHDETIPASPVPMHACAEEAAAFALWAVQSHPRAGEPEWWRLPEVVRDFYRRQVLAALARPACMR
jgi:hypothetical protein